MDKWERARIENFKFKFKTKEIELQRKITELQVKLETEKLVDAENERFLNYSINVSNSIIIVMLLKIKLMDLIFCCFRN